MNAIELSHINRSFGEFAIQDLCLSVPSGTICGLVGENGAGKSTTIRLLMGALRPDSGTARVLGTDVSSPAFREVKEDIGEVLDEAYFPETLTAAEVGKVLAKTYARWDQGVYDGYLRRFDLPGRKPFKDFSRGMKMKLAIAAALSHRPKLLVLDEATSGLDPIVRDEVLEIFNEFTREEDHSILISSHILSDLAPGSLRRLRRDGGAAGEPPGRGGGRPGGTRLRRSPGPGPARRGPGGAGAGAGEHRGYHPLHGERSGKMEALLLKDLCVLWKQMRMMLLILAFLSVVGGAFNSVFVVVWCALLPYTAIAYDERSHWDQLAAMMPFSKRDLVLSKYVLGWLCMAAATVLSLAFQTAAFAFNHEAPSLSVWAMCFLGGTLALDLTLPMVFRFGVEKGRWGFMIIVFGVAVLGGVVAGAAEELPGMPVPAMALLPLAAVAATAVSIPLSMKLYRLDR